MFLVVSLNGTLSSAKVELQYFLDYLTLKKKLFLARILLSVGKILRLWWGNKSTLLVRISGPVLKAKDKPDASFYQHEFFPPGLKFEVHSYRDILCSTEEERGQSVRVLCKISIFRLLKNHKVLFLAFQV
jgi:hypothetical protein